MKLKRTAIAAIASLALCTAAFAQAETGGAQFFPGSEPGSLVLVGNITLDTLPRFQAALAQYPDTQTIELVSSGGYVVPAIQIGYEIYDRGLDTRIAEGSLCYSACGFVFLAGARREIEGALGLHQARAAEGELTTDQQKAIDAYIVAALETFGTDPALITAMLETDDASMHVFGWEEVARYNIERGHELPAVEAMNAQMQAGQAN